MHFSSFNDFISMGGYGFYVWLSYGISYLLLLLLVIFSVRTKKVLLKNIAQRDRHEQKLKQLRKEKHTNESKT